MLGTQASLCIALRSPQWLTGNQYKLCLCCRKAGRIRKSCFGLETPSKSPRCRNYLGPGRKEGRSVQVPWRLGQGGECVDFNGPFAGRGTGEVRAWIWSLFWVWGPSQPLNSFPLRLYSSRGFRGNRSCPSTQGGTGGKAGPSPACRLPGPPRRWACSLQGKLCAALSLGEQRDPAEEERAECGRGTGK